MRFFDDAEVILFCFPQDSYYDGTFIDGGGKDHRLNDYDIKPLGFTEAGGYRFSSGWKVAMKGVKAEEYTITPVSCGQFILFFFELLAEIRDGGGELVGYSFVELLPGVYYERINSFNAFRKI